MITRQLQTRLEQRLRQFPAVALLGPRQVGKTTLARNCPAAAAALYPDLENPADLERLADARGYLDGRRGRLTIIDESPAIST